jgi:hypothetical protein
LEFARKMVDDGNYSTFWQHIKSPSHANATHHNNNPCTPLVCESKGVPPSLLNNCPLMINGTVKKCKHLQSWERWLRKMICCSFGAESNMPNQTTKSQIFFFSCVMILAIVARKHHDTILQHPKSSNIECPGIQENVNFEYFIFFKKTCFKETPSA